MRQTKVDPLEHARAIVHNCLAREFGRTNSAEGTYEPLLAPSGNRDLLGNGIVVLIGIFVVVAVVAVVAWVLTQ